MQKTGGSPEQYKHPCLIGDVNFRQTAGLLGAMIAILLLTLG